MEMSKGAGRMTYSNLAELVNDMVASVLVRPLEVGDDHTHVVQCRRWDGECWTGKHRIGVMLNAVEYRGTSSFNLDGLDEVRPAGVTVDEWQVIKDRIIARVSEIQGAYLADPRTWEARPVELNRTWVDDAQSRDLDIGAEVKRTNRMVTLEMTPAQIYEARSAACYDADLMRMSGDLAFAGFAASARATIRRLDLAEYVRRYMILELH